MMAMCWWRGSARPGARGWSGTMVAGAWMLQAGGRAGGRGGAGGGAAAALARKLPAPPAPPRPAPLRPAPLRPAAPRPRTGRASGLESS
jgi:hypothetical protein